MVRAKMVVMSVLVIMMMTMSVMVIMVAVSSEGFGDDGGSDNVVTAEMVVTMVMVMEIAMIVKSFYVSI